MFFSGSIGEGRDLGVVGVPGELALDGGSARVNGGGAKYTGSLAFSAPNADAAECRVRV